MLSKSFLFLGPGWEMWEEVLSQQASDLPAARRALLALCETLPRAEAARALRDLHALHDTTPWVRALLEVGELDKRLHDAVQLSPDERRALWARERAERTAVEVAHQERVDRLEATRQLRARHLAHAERTYRRMARASWWRRRPFRKVPGVEGKILRTADLRVVTPVEWLGVRLRAQPTDVRLALTHKIHTFAQEQGRTHVPPAVVAALQDAFDVYAEADLVPPQTRFAKWRQRAGRHVVRAVPVA